MDFTESGEAEAELYDFWALSTTAQADALEWIDTLSTDYDPSSIVNAAVATGRLIGIEFEPGGLEFELRYGKSRGCSIGGRYRSSRSAVASIMREEPTDFMLHSVAILLHRTHEQWGWGLEARILPRVPDISDTQNRHLSEQQHDMDVYPLRDYRKPLIMVSDGANPYYDLTYDPGGRAIRWCINTFTEWIFERLRLHFDEWLRCYLTNHSYTFTVEGHPNSDD